MGVQGGREREPQLAAAPVVLAAAHRRAASSAQPPAHAHPRPAAHSPEQPLLGLLRLRGRPHLAQHVQQRHVGGLQGGGLEGEGGGWAIVGAGRKAVAGTSGALCKSPPRHQLEAPPSCRPEPLPQTGRAPPGCGAQRAVTVGIQPTGCAGGWVGKRERVWGRPAGRRRQPASQLCPPASIRAPQPGAQPPSRPGQPPSSCTHQLSNVMESSSSAPGVAQGRSTSTVAASAYSRWVSASSASSWAAGEGAGSGRAAGTEIGRLGVEQLGAARTAAVQAHKPSPDPCPSPPTHRAAPGSGPPAFPGAAAAH